ncbi:hypothetical protein G7Y79_00011g031260 [Physcia stellaris]|nr:hypothetical protein G7Y79_00011g031260 [Physcia stellaris]
MAESTWPTLRIGIPNNISDHATCLQNDFEEVHKSLQTIGGTVVPRHLFEILHRSYSRLCAKLNIEREERSSHNIALSANAKCEEHHEGPLPVALTACEEDDTGVHQVPSTSTSDRKRNSQTNQQHNPEYVTDLGEQEQAQRPNTETGEPTSEKSDQHRRSHSEASSSCVVLRTQNPEPDWGQTTGINHRDETLRKAMVEAMHQSKFSISLGVDSDVLTEEKDRESLLRHFEILRAVDMSLDIYDAINEDPAILDPSSLWICYSKITRKKNLQIFVSSAQDLSRLEASDYWKTRLATKSITNIRRKDPSAFPSLGKGELPSAILKNASILASVRTMDVSKPVVGLDPDKLGLVVRTPWKYSKQEHKGKKPGKILAMVRSVINVDPALNMNWVTAARLTKTDDVGLLVTDKQALNMLLLDKEWKVRLRSQLGNGQAIFRVLMKDVPVSSLISCGLGSKRNRSMFTRHIELCNSTFGGNVIRTINLAPQVSNEGLGKSSIIIDFNKPEPANRALTQGLIWDGERYDCVRWFEGDVFEQCYTCQAFEHYEMECGGEVRCGKCAGDHHTIYCNESFSKCVFCNGAHDSTDSNCPSRLHHEAQAKLAVPPKLPFKSAGDIPKPTKEMAVKTHKHKRQPRPPNPLPRRKLKKMAISRVGQVDHDTAMSDWLGGVEFSKDSAEPAAPKRKAAEPLEVIAGNMQRTATAKRIKREEAEEDPIQQYIRENGAIPWPPSREERTVDTMEALSRRQRPGKSNAT